LVKIVANASLTATVVIFGSRYCYENDNLIGYY
jgi:hypothetical protein